LPVQHSGLSLLVILGLPEAPGDVFWDGGGRDDANGVSWRSRDCTFTPCVGLSDSRGRAMGGRRQATRLSPAVWLGHVWPGPIQLLWPGGTDAGCSPF
jgi:hypothetical protein